MLYSNIQDFFGAVNALRTINGRGIFSVTRTAPQTYHIWGNYQTYACRDLGSILYSSGYMNSTLSLLGEGDQLFFELKDYHADLDLASIAHTALQDLQRFVGVSGDITSQRDDFFGFKFQT